MVEQFVIYGPPGTGKTTYLIDKVEEVLKNGIKPDKIAFLSFTNKSVDEAIKRACTKFNFIKNDLPYFVTIHALCKRQCNIKNDEVIQLKHLQELGNMLGVEITGNKNFNDSFYGVPIGDKMIHLIDLAKSRNEDLKTDEEIPLNELKRFNKSYIEYKKQRLLLDFSDMLYKFLKEGFIPKLDLLIVDEAQDLSNIQWKIIYKLIENTKLVFIAGDDDQGIYKWNGADTNEFINLSGTRIILDNSYRLPNSIYTFSNRIICRIKNRINKPFKPKDILGNISFEYNIDNIDFSKGNWLLLARNFYFLKQYEDICKENGYAYDIAGKSPLFKEGFNAIRTWETLRKGYSVSIVKILKMLKEMTINQYDKDLLKTLKQESKEAKFTLEDLQKQINLKTIEPWYIALDNMYEKDKLYFRMALSNGENLIETPRIHINTIHGVKGGEADNVIILADMAYSTFKAYEEDPDEENRVFYVGITRSKENLFIVYPNTPYYFNFDIN